MNDGSAVGVEDGIVDGVDVGKTEGDEDGLPDGINDGKNDGFRGYGEGIDWDTYEMSIFNRWGELIYYTEDINDPWDGTYRGAQVEVAVYVWKINFNDVKGEKHDYYGHVTLVR